MLLGVDQKFDVHLAQLVQLLLHLVLLLLESGGCAGQRSLKLRTSRVSVLTADRRGDEGHRVDRTRNCPRHLLLGRCIDIDEPSLAFVALRLLKPGQTAAHLVTAHHCGRLGSDLLTRVGEEASDEDLFGLVLLP